MSARTVVAPCPLCGGVSIAPVTSTPPLLAVADYLVERVLAKVGVILTRGGGGGMSRPKCAVAASAARARGLAPTEAWLAYRASGDVVDHAVKLATDDWRVISLMLDTDGAIGVSERQVRAVLTDYVHDLIAEQRPHARDGLRLRLHVALGLEVHAVTPLAAAV